MTQDTVPAKVAVHSADTAEQNDNKDSRALQSAYEGPDPAKLTHRELVEVIIRERGWESSNKSGRSFRSHITTWCKSLGLSIDDPAQRSLARGFDDRLNAVTDNLAEAQSKSQAKNVRWAAGELNRVFESICTHGSLPSDFAMALKRSVEAKGWKPLDLIRAMREVEDKYCKSTVYDFLAGRKAPRYPQSLQVVIRMEKALGLPENTLVSRAFRRPRLIKLGNASDIAYRKNQARTVKSCYSLKELPKQLKPTWTQLADWRSRTSLRVNGTVYVPESPPWVGPNSAKKYEANLRRFFGWLVLPKARKPALELSEKERWETGKGIKAEAITLAHVFNTDLIWEFFEFLRGRQAEHEFTQDTLHYAIFLNSLVNHPYSFVTAHPELAPPFGKRAMPRAKWVKFTETIHQDILQLCRGVRKAKPKNGKKHRTADEPLKEVIEDADPAALFLQMIDELERTIPARCHKISRAVRLRDIALFRLCMEVPLRAKNLAELTFGLQLIRDAETKCWRVAVPLKALKNRHSKHARDIYRKLSVQASAAIDRYLEEGRMELPAAAHTRLFLVKGVTGPRRVRKEKPTEIELFGVPPASLYWVVRSHTEKVFGVGQGPNVFRHIVATSLLKDNNSAKVAAAVLNNSEKMINDNYGHVRQKDYLRLADDWLEKKRRDRQIRLAVEGQR